MRDGIILRARIDPQRELEEAHLAIANLGIENAILESRPRPARFLHGRALVRVAVLIIAGSAGAALWVETRNLGLLLMITLFLGLGWGVLWLIGVLEPTNVNPREPRNDNHLPM